MLHQFFGIRESRTAIASLFCLFFFLPLLFAVPSFASEESSTVINSKGKVFCSPSSRKVPGPRGHTGSTGPTGPTGHTGATGPGGLIGPAGPKGDHGRHGSKGHKGKKGHRGPRGKKGEDGERGKKGKRGHKGHKGDKGEKGDKGDRGAKGCVGPVGATGHRGCKGEKGHTGATGPKGLRGITGHTGATGPSLTENFASIIQTVIPPKTISICSNDNLFVSFPNPPTTISFTGGGITYDSSTGKIIFTDSGSYQINFGFSPTSDNRAIALNLNDLAIDIPGTFLHNNGLNHVLVSQSIIISIDAGDSLTVKNRSGDDFDLGTTQPNDHAATVSFITIVRLN